MHRWDFMRFIRWLVPVVLLLMLLCLVIAGQKAHEVGLAFEDDDSYVDIAVARNLLTSGQYGVWPGHSMMAIKDPLWRLLLAATGWLIGNVLAAPYLLGAIFAIATLLVCLRMLRLLFPFPPFIFYTALLLLGSPGLVSNAVSGTSLPLATLLVCLACLLHIEGLSGRRSVLPMMSAFLLGLAMWLRMEFFVLWLVFLVHAIFMNFFQTRAQRSLVLVLIRGMSGLLLMALCILPLLAWNYGLWRIPWPQALGAPMTADAMASLSPAQAFQHLLELFRAALPESFARLKDIPFLQSGLSRGVAGGGLVLLTGLSITHKEERPYLLILFLAVLLPVFYALAYPFLGWASAVFLFQSLNPIFVIPAALLVFRLPFLIEELYRKWKEGIPEAAGFTLWWLVAGSLLMLVCLVATGRQVALRINRLTETQSARQAVARRLPLGASTLVMTDQPGWMVWQWREPLMDLTGELDPTVLTCLDSRGRVAPDKVRRWVEDRQPVAAVLWDRNNDELVRPAGFRPVLSLPSRFGQPGPQVWMKARSAAP